jgi:superoxide dismutase, Cu-Zn family
MPESLCWRAIGMRSWLVCVVASLMMSSVAHAQPAPPPPQPVPGVGASAAIRDANGSLLATANFREGRGEVLISIVFPGQPVLSGAHAVHIATVGRCDPPDFSNSGGIFNPFNKQHGRGNPDGAEVGDLPNVTFSTAYNTSAIGATLGAGPGSLLSPSRSMLIYSGQDDQQSQPDGNAGAPIGCGVITPTPGSPAAVGAPSPSPVVVGVASSPLPVAKPAVAAAPTPILVLPTNVPLAATSPQPQTTGGTSTLNSLVIAVLGLCLVGVGYALRRTPAR